MGMGMGKGIDMDMDSALVVAIVKPDIHLSTPSRTH